MDYYKYYRVPKVLKVMNENMSEVFFSCVPACCEIVDNKVLCNDYYCEMKNTCGFRDGGEGKWKVKNR